MYLYVISYLSLTLQNCFQTVSIDTNNKNRLTKLATLRVTYVKTCPLIVCRRTDKWLQEALEVCRLPPHS